MQKMIKQLLLTTMTAGAAIATGITFTAQDTKISVTEALSGGTAQYGVAIRNGFQLAADGINTAGGINGSKITPVIEDGQGKKEETINVFKKLIFQDKVTMVFDLALSNSAQAVDPIAQASKTVAFGTSNTADGITSVGDFVFRSSMTEADMLPVTIQTVTKKVGVKKMAVFYGNDDVSTESGYGNFKKALGDLEIPVATTETFAKGDVDFKTQLAKIKTTNPDTIVLSVLIAEGGPIMVQACRLGLNVPVIDGSGMSSVKVFNLAKNESNNLRMGSPWSIENHTPEGSKFITAYTTKYKAAPDQFATQACDVMCTTNKALKTVKLSDSLEADHGVIRDVLSTVRHTGATGAFTFRQVTARGKPADYDAMQTPIVNVTKNGKYTIKR